MSWLRPKRNRHVVHDPQPERKDEPDKVEKGVAQEDEMQEYPSFKVVLPIVLAVCLAVFLTALDRTIIGVAVPTISTEFKAYSDIAWYESAYLLTFAALQLPMGKIFTFFPAKWAFITILAIFLVGSIVIAAAPTSAAFIVGRAITGIGSAGVTTGAQIIFTDLLPLEKRPKYQGFLGATFGLASIAGPLLGGLFTSKVTWRWCFWINLPIGGVALFLLLLILPASPAGKSNVGKTLWQNILMFDPVGCAILLPGLILLLLALQWGGSEYSWQSTPVLVTLILGIVLLVAFIVSQIFIGENATVPPRIVRNRSIAAAAVFNFGLGSTLIIITFFLPQWYQVVHELSPVASGIRMLAYFLTTVVCVIVSGGLVSKLGYYTPWMIGGSVLLTIGCGLLTTVDINTSTAKLIGYQMLVGGGIGFTLAQSYNAAQTVLERADIPTGVTVLAFPNFVGGTIFVSVCQGILSNTLISDLRLALPELDSQSILAAGAAGLTDLVSKAQLPLLKSAYNKGVCNVYYCALGLSGLAFIASLFVEWKTVKMPEEKADDQEER